MGWRKAIRDPIAIQAYERFEKFPSKDWHKMENPYCLVAFRLTTNSNPKVPMTGYAVYACEVIKMTPRSAILCLSERVEMFGYGTLPNSPIQVMFSKADRVKLLGWKVLEED